MFDEIWEVTTASGETRLVVAEYKGAGATQGSFSKRQIGGVDYQQGSSEYFLDTLRAMLSREQAIDNDALQEILLAAESGTLDYLLVTTKNLNRPDVTAVSFQRFVLPTDDGFVDSIDDIVAAIAE